MKIVYTRAEIQATPKVTAADLREGQSVWIPTFVTRGAYVERITVKRITDNGVITDKDVVCQDCIFLLEKPKRLKQGRFD